MSIVNLVESLRERSSWRPNRVLHQVRVCCHVKSNAFHII